LAATSHHLHLRDATSDDEAFLRAVYAGTRADELALTGWEEEQKGVFCQMQFDAQDRHYRLHYPGAQFLVIESDGIPAGRLYVHHGENEIRILDISLLPAHRGAGIGTRLLCGLQAEAAALGRPLTIRVEKFNPAQRLYQRLGFRQMEDQGAYLSMEWRSGELEAQ
jgi:ribosomal protein S18 acetylase RimI-like enzyme